MLLIYIHVLPEISSQLWGCSPGVAALQVRSRVFHAVMLSYHALR